MKKTDVEMVKPVIPSIATFAYMYQRRATAMKVVAINLECMRSVLVTSVKRQPLLAILDKNAVIYMDTL